MRAGGSLEVYHSYVFLQAFLGESISPQPDGLFVQGLLMHGALVKMSNVESIRTARQWALIRSSFCIRYDRGYQKIGHVGGGAGLTTLVFALLLFIIL